ncbi:MCE family protein [Mycolicibacter hiberniae]|uniref:Mammalian cell entry protein n=1 Tax=Mycolicibacter hiberniae TaxID=29314 RepID=A0A7I7X458_9MYCO|nr:MCE family protein [Mycolicibacter hiberniae]MCV7086237.1 MCE family protein [Mycolicibacter hiberniae]ORV68227.1 mammalian cell entry protein [Mycolicibacter hiberniae]BBZ24609.1 mammalian cell entry protein [Mycolicibacter hiberniae]
MLSRLVRIQLGIFAVVTVLAVGAISILYLHAPSRLGIGTYKVTADFIGGGGIYKSANVTYRGVTVGRVEDVRLTDHGVDAQMRLNSSTKIPGNVTATVKSMSAIGEQYIDLVPPADAAAVAAAGSLRGGARIGQDRTAIGQDIAGLLDEAQTLVNSVANSRLRELLHSAFEGFNGSGQELARMIASSRQLVDEANDNFDATSALIDQFEPFLDAQIRSGDDIKRLARSLAAVTTEVRNADPQLREVLQILPSVTDEANTTFSGIRASFPTLAASMANFGRIGVIYRKSIEQALVVFPALMAALMTVAGGVPMEEGVKLDFKIDMHDPPPCTVGFLPFTDMRSPADETVRDLPKDLYCKAAQNDSVAVRGARNYPCMEYPGKRAPTIQLCRDPRGFVPIGSNAWRGPPVPYGTPVTDPRMTNPMNKFPYIPPEADYDPGPPVVALPPGVPAGPGPAPNPPFPLPYPPNALGPAPAPWPYYAPPDQNMPTSPGGNGGLPAYGRDPAPAPAPAEAQANGVAYSSYDQRSGKFVDPAGETGVFVSGADKWLPAENWADLMLEPRQT